MDIKKLKMKKTNINMTEGSPIRLLLMFSIPMLIGNLFQQVYNLVDTIVVGQYLGKNALAAVGATGSATFLFFALCNGIASGGSIIVSQLFGGQDYKALRKCMTNVAYIMIIMSAVVGTVAYILTEPLLVFLKTDPEVIADSIKYMHIMCIGIVFVSLYNYVSSMLRAFGDSITPLIFLLFSCVVNGALDVILVMNGFGVLGAAYATITSQCLSGVLSLIFALKTNEFFKFSKEDYKFDGALVWKTIKLGVPLSLQYSLIAISCMAMQSVVNSFGTVATAAFTATGRIESVIHQPYQTFAASLATYTGQNYGANKKKRIIRGYLDSIKLMAVFTLVMVVIMQVMSGLIIRIFISDAEVIAMGAKALKITSIFYIFLGTLYVIRGVLNGLGDGLFAMINGIVEVIGRFTVPFLLVSVADVWSIWWATGIVWAIAGITAWIRFVQHGSKKLKLRHRDLMKLYSHKDYEDEVTDVTAVQSGV